MFVLPGGSVALDDTAGFMIGPNLQVQAMVANGAYQFLEERGGISFLRKNHDIGPLACHKPCAEVWFARLHVTSARLGAMDPGFRSPSLPHQPVPLAEWIDRFWHTSPSETFGLILRKLRRRGGSRSSGSSASDGLQVASSIQRALEWLRFRQNLVIGATFTLDYLDACRVMRASGHKEALESFAKLAEASSGTRFVHYNLPVALVAKLRLAQCHDLSGNRKDAASLFMELDSERVVPALRDAASPWKDRPFAIPSGGNPLLREYNLAWLDHKIQTPA